MKEKTVFPTIVLSLLTFSGSPLGISLLATLPTAPLPSFLYLPVSVLAFSAMPLLFLWLGLAFCAPFYFAYIAMRGLYKERRLPTLVLWGISWGCLGLWLHIPIRSREVRYQWLSAVPARAQPLINAIERYKSETGKYPQELNVLVPRYLATIPSTGMVGFPGFRYRLPSEQYDLSHNPYELRVDTPIGFLNWDCFVYWPRGNYRERMYGGSIERIGDWVYVNE